MSKLVRATFVLAALAVSAHGLAAQATTPLQTTEPLTVGAMAPDFTLAGATRYGVLDQQVKLSDFRGKTVVIAFFPRARTRGCTIQMRAYRDQYPELFSRGLKLSDAEQEAILSTTPGRLWFRD